MEVIKRVKELVLCFFFASDKLHVIDDEDVNVAVLLGKTLFFEADVVEEFVDERFSCRVENARFWLLADDFVADGLHKVGFTEASATVEEERIVLLAGVVSDRSRGGIGEVVARADDEVVEGIAGVEIGC